MNFAVRFAFRTSLFLALLGGSGCFSTQTLVDSASTADSSGTSLDDGIAERFGEGSEEIPPLGQNPDDIFGSEPTDPRIPPIADAGQPSVFSSQVGVVNNPGQTEILCSIQINLPLGEIADLHEGQCPDPGGIVANQAPYANLWDVHGEFFEVYTAVCNDKYPGEEFWELDAFIDSYSFLYVHTEQVPKEFMFEIYILSEGIWQRAQSYSLVIYCEES